MTQFDTSFYKDIAKPNDPLKVLQNYASTANTMGQNQLLQMEIGAKRELGEILSESTDQETGDIDYSKAFKLSKNSQYGGLNTSKLAELRNSQGTAEQVFDPSTGQNVLRPRQYIQRTAEENALNARKRLMAVRQSQQNVNPQTQQQSNPFQQEAQSNPLQQDQTNLLQQTPRSNAPQQNPETNPLTGQTTDSMAQPDPQTQQLPQDQIDKLHSHNKAMLDKLGPLMDNPNLTHKDVIGAVSDLVADQDAQFNSMDGANAISKIPFGPNGPPLSGEELRAKLAPVVQQLQQNQDVLGSKYPSSEMIRPPTQQPMMNSPQGGAVNMEEPNLTENITLTPQPGWTSPLPKSRESYDQVVDAAATVPQKLYAYNEIINLANSGAESGTNIAKMYQWAAKNVPGIPQGITDKAAQSQELSKFMSQALLANGMPNSDSRLQELQSGNLNPEQLITTIKQLAPAFKAVAQGAVEKQKFYNRMTSNGHDLSREPEAAQIWNQYYDPRWIEYADQADKKAKKEFLSHHPDMIEKADNLKVLKQMGVIGAKE